MIRRPELYLADKDIPSLLSAIVMQAVKDWLSLCDGMEEAPDCNFPELEEFFSTDCAKYISHDVAARIYKLMQEERKRKLGY